MNIQYRTDYTVEQIFDQLEAIHNRIEEYQDELDEDPMFELYPDDDYVQDTERHINEEIDALCALQTRFMTDLEIIHRCSPISV